jgi:type II secretory pathway pseudopilin PulG
MPELSKPLIAIIGVVVSVAVLFIAIAGFLPFFQQSVSSATQAVNFQATASAATTQNTVVFTVNIQKVVGQATYNIVYTDVQVIANNGTTLTSNDFSMNPTLITFTADTSSASFTISVTSSNPDGNWILIIPIKDAGSGDTVQTITLTVYVA